MAERLTTVKGHWGDVHINLNFLFHTPYHRRFGHKIKDGELEPISFGSIWAGGELKKYWVLATGKF